MNILTFANQPIAASLLFEDSYHVPNFAQQFLNLDNAATFDTLTNTAPWTNPSDDEMKYRGRELPRQKAFWTATHDPLHKYSYPAWQWKSMLSYRPFTYTPIIQQLVDTMQRDLRIENQALVINHVIGTRYRDSNDTISFHSDKVKDITLNSPIISLSFGETREMHICKNGDEKNVHVFVLGPGDLFILGWRTNAAYQHSIVPVNKERQIQRQPNVPVGPRISLVMRNIATTISRKELAKEIKKSIKRRKIDTAE